MGTTVEEFLAFAEAVKPFVLSLLGPQTTIPVAAGMALAIGLVKAFTAGKKPEEITREDLGLPDYDDRMRDKGIDPDTMRPIGAE